jgi:hypothetical protein
MMGSFSHFVFFFTPAVLSIIVTYCDYIFVFYTVFLFTFSTFSREVNLFVAFSFWAECCPAPPGGGHRLQMTLTLMTRVVSPTIFGELSTRGLKPTCWAFQVGRWVGSEQNWEVKDCTSIRNDTWTKCKFSLQDAFVWDRWTGRGFSFTAEEMAEIMLRYHFFVERAGWVEDKILSAIPAVATCSHVVLKILLIVSLDNSIYVCSTNKLHFVSQYDLRGLRNDRFRCWRPCVIWLWRHAT